jgi:hypothetical protein
MRNCVICFIAFFSNFAFAQTDQIRNPSKPKQAYFQQEVHYTINVALDDVNHMLQADERIRYINHSPDTLTEIWFHLWPNGYKNTETAFAKQELLNGSTKFQFANEDERGFIDNLNFQVDGATVSFVEDKNNIDIGKIILKKPLAPGAEITISTPFRVKIPSSKFSRLGHSGQQYQLCQWYPKPAVYDAKGWHAFPYLNEGEFYSEFGTFKVSITTPENYVIAASGDMEANPDEQNRIDVNCAKTDSLKKAGIPKNGLSNPTPPSSSILKTVTYTLSDVHDFAWFADKNYHILKSSVALPKSGRTVETYCYFADKDANDWIAAPQYVNDAVYNYSKWLGDYPYKVCKAVDGALSAGAGMEYPTITIIASQGNPIALDEVIAHEVGHNWFYGILGSNERDYPWMDEGSNSYYEERYMHLKYPNRNEIDAMIPKVGNTILHTNDFRPNALRNLFYQFVARRNDDQSLALHSEQFSSMNYGAIVYKKTANIYNYLAAFMGQETFDEMMQAYYETWKFKHPQPEDFRLHVENFNGISLPWLFDGLLGSVNRVDYKICGFKKNNSKTYVSVRNVGQINGPVSVSGFKGDSVLTKWYDGFEGKRQLIFPLGDFDRYSVNGTGAILDFNPKNDEMRTSGIFRKTGKIKLQIGTGIDYPRVTPIYVMPALGYNVYNGFMLGGVFHNIGLLRKNFEYQIMPLYGSNNKELAGAAQFDYFIRPTDAFFRNLTLTASAERYALRFAPNYNRIVLGGTFDFAKRNESTKKSSSLNIRHIFIQSTPYINSPDAISITQENNYNQVIFSHKNNRVLNPYSIVIDAQQGNTFVKASATWNYRISYKQNKKGLDIRFFAGTFLWTSNDYKNSPDVRFRLSGQTGAQDYLYNDIFVGRQENSGLWSRQMTMTDGGFTLPTAKGQSDRFMTSVNLKTSLPSKIPFKIYANFAYFGYTVESGNNPDQPSVDSSDFATEAGISLPLLGNDFEIFFPLLFSENLKPYNGKNLLFEQRIRFVLNINAFNPAKIFRTLDF